MARMRAKLRTLLEYSLSPQLLELAGRTSLKLRHCFWFVSNPNKLRQCKKMSGVRLHLGCSGHRLPDFINIDVRWTWATDVTCDLTTLDWPPGQVATVYSNAFFEHLRRPARISHLQSIYRALSPDVGVLCYTGVPYFRNIAKFYLANEKGIHNQPVFDLASVYRYTHGDPDRMQGEGWYFEQLHKSLFDEEEISRLLDEAGFVNYAIFSYVYPDDPNPLPVNLGFFALRALATPDSLQRMTREFIAQFPQYIRYDTVTFLQPAALRTHYQV